jgi:hypothetical protein
MKITLPKQSLILGMLPLAFLPLSAHALPSRSGPGQQGGLKTQCAADHHWVATTYGGYCAKGPQQLPSPVILTNGDVLRLFKAGIPADIIVAKIKNSQTKFDTSPDALIALKAAHLPNAVIMAMVDATPVSAAEKVLTPCGPGGGSLKPCPGTTTRTESTSAPALPSPPPLVQSPEPSPGHGQEGPTASNTSTPGLAGGGQGAWQPEFDMGGQLYPSMILELEGSSSRLSPHSSANYIGDPMGMAGVKILCRKAGEVAHVAVRIDGLSDQSTMDATLQQPGNEYYIYPVIRYDTAKLERASESYPTTVEYSVTIGGTDESQKTISIQVHSVNDVPFAVEFHSGKVKNLSPLFAGYVDENNPFVQTLLQQALNVHAVNQFDGYQSGPQGVEMQVFAIWNVLQRRHMHYSSTATASAQSQWGWVSVGEPEGRVVSQTVRFLDQSIANQQANCIDGAVLFASALYKIGIDPLLVILPGHAFVGYFIDPQHQRPQFLEATLVGQGPMPFNIPFGALYPITATASWKQFLNAVQVGNKEFDTQVRPHVGRDPRYMLIDIQKAREAGINPIPRPL